MRKIIVSVLAGVVFLLLAFDTYVAIEFERIYCLGHDLFRTLFVDMPAGHC